MSIIQDLNRIQNETEVSLIQKPKRIWLTLKRLETSNGLGKIKPNQSYRLGSAHLVDMDSIRGMEVVARNGDKVIMPVVNEIDPTTGKDLGIIWAELFFL